MPGNTDELTGLLTVNAFLEQLDPAIRSGENLALVVMDLDHLLGFNDRYGHLAGDEWIRLTSQMFKQTFAGEGSIIGRYGGDEFMAAVRESNLYEAYLKAEALRQRIEQEKPAITFDGVEVRPGSTIALGLAAFPANAGDMNDLIEKGKQALMRAKVAGGNQVCLYQETDTLTGVLNFYAVQRALEEALVKARQAHDSLSVFVMDIDRFAEINNEYGHRAGDEVLKRLGRILQTNFKGPSGGPDAGLPGRISGDEFVVILPGQRADSTFILAEEIRRLVEDSELPITLGQSERTFTLHFHISGGIASFPSDATERVDLLRKADEALYRAKQTGRNRICLPDSAQMVTKTSHYTPTQLVRLATVARRLDRSEAFLLREALDDLLRKYQESEP